MDDCFDLPAELTVYSALDTRDALLRWLAGRDPKDQPVLDISAAAVMEIDGAGLQLLAAMANMDHSWRLVGATEAFTNACSTLGLASWSAVA